MKLTIQLISPYKWGKGWTASSDEHELFDQNSEKILDELNIPHERSSHGVPQAQDNWKSAYMHPMEFTFEEVSEARAREILEVVKNNAKGFYSVGSAMLRDGDKRTEL
jgi:hypothetical protein